MFGIILKEIWSLVQFWSQTKHIVTFSGIKWQYKDITVRILPPNDFQVLQYHKFRCALGVSVLTCSHHSSSRSESSNPQRWGQILLRVSRLVLSWCEVVNLKENKPNLILSIEIVKLRGTKERYHWQERVHFFRAIVKWSSCANTHHWRLVCGGDESGPADHGCDNGGEVWVGDDGGRPVGVRLAFLLAATSLPAPRQ